jgi:hypothetical protein
MDILLAIISGITTKLYDDLYDNNFLSNETLKESLKGINWILFTLLAYNDFNFAFVFYLINALCLISEPEFYLSYPYEASIVFLFPLLILYSFSTRKSISFYDGFYMVYFMTVMMIEPILFKEEYSLKKMFFRIVAFVYSVMGGVLGLYFGVSTSFIKISAFGIGYGLVSSIFQAYMVIGDDISKTISLHT